MATATLQALSILVLAVGCGSERAASPPPSETTAATATRAASRPAPAPTPSVGPAAAPPAAGASHSGAADPVAPAPPGATASANGTPGAPPDPAAPVAPGPASSDPPAALVALPRTLAAEGVTRIFRSDDVFGSASRREPRIAATTAADRTGTWFCLEPEGAAPRCVTISDRPVSVQRPTKTTNGEVQVSYRDAERFWVYTILSPSGPPSATRRPDQVGATRTPLPAPAARAAPAWLGALRGLDVVSFPRVVAAGARGWLRVCPELAPSCPPPIVIPAMQQDRVSIHDVMDLFGDTYGVTFEWETQRDAVEESGMAEVFVRAGDVLVLRFTAVQMMERLAPVRPGSAVREEWRMEANGMDLMSESCFQAEQPTGERTRIDEDESEEPIGPIRFRRAPAAVPATGVADPLALSMQGAWNVARDGGLSRRAGSCPEE